MCTIKIKLCACTYVNATAEQCVRTDGSLELFDGCCVSYCASDWLRLECNIWPGCMILLNMIMIMIMIMIWLGWALLYCFQEVLCSLYVHVHVCY